MSGKSSQLDFIPTSLLWYILYSHCSTMLVWLIYFSPKLFFEQNSSWHKYHLFWRSPGSPNQILQISGLISNLNTIGKILERLALARLLPHLSISHSFSPLQSAYRKFYSTETALLKQIFAALDMYAAFDTLDHTTLLRSVYQELSTPHSYLTNRSSFVMIDSSSSSCDTTSFTGVPQG